MPVNAIDAEKSLLRQQAKERRRLLDPTQKAALDRCILDRVTDLLLWRQTELLLCYLSGPLEVDIRSLIACALSDGRSVAAPRIGPKKGEMAFYRFFSPHDLQFGPYGLQQPAADFDRLVTDTNNSLCLVPGLIYDRQGYRLGWGGGYYDRFLARFDGIAIGLCYADEVTDRLPRAPYDRPVDMLITDRQCSVFDGKEGSR